MGSDLILWTRSNGCLTVSSIKRNINNVCWAEQEGVVTPPSGEKPRTLVKQSIHRLKPVKMLKDVKDLRCNPKSFIAQRHTLVFYIYHIYFKLCDRSQD